MFTALTIKYFELTYKSVTFKIRIVAKQSHLRQMQACKVYIKPESLTL